MRPSTGLDYSHDDPSIARTGLKLIGLGAGLVLVGTIYWLAPEYRGGFYDMLRILMPAWLMLAPPYFFFVDQHMCEPRGCCWHLGSAVLLRFDVVDRAIVGQSKRAIDWHMSEILRKLKVASRSQAVALLGTRRG